MDDATLAVQTGRYSEALPLVDQALALDPNNFEAYVVRGIALSQTNQPDEATSSFLRAIELNPSTPKPFYNLAVHYYGLGRREPALDMARKANAVDPSHEGSRSLSLKIEQELGMAAGPSGPTRPYSVPGAEGGAEPPIAGAEYFREPYREGYDSDPDNVHSIPMVEKFGKNWMLLGWILAALPIVLFGLSWIIAPTMALGGPRGPGGQPTLNGLPTMLWVTLFVRLLAVIFSMVWMIMDILDRRHSLIWIIPYIVCCCCGVGVLQGVMQMVYMLVGRRR